MDTSWRGPDRLLAHDDLDDTHGGAAAAADECRRWRYRAFIADECRLRSIEQGPHPEQILPSAGVGEQPVVANTVETTWQDVQKKSAHELLGRERHRLVTGTPLGPVILPAEGHTVLIHRHQSPVRDGHPVGVAGQVSQYCRGTGEWTLGIHHPFAGSQWRQPATKRSGIDQARVFSEELQMPGMMQLLQFFEEAPPEQP